MSSLFGAVEDMCLKKISKALEIVQIFFWLISGIFYSNDCVCDKKKVIYGNFPRVQETYTIRPVKIESEVEHRPRKPICVVKLHLYKLFILGKHFLIKKKNEKSKEHSTLFVTMLIVRSQNTISYRFHRTIENEKKVVNNAQNCQHAHKLEN